MKLADFMVKDAIVPELKANDRDGAIRELVMSLANAKVIGVGDVDAIVRAIIDRERTGSTGIGKGVAVPHLKHGAIKKRAGALGRSTIGIDFASLDQAPVYSVFLLLSPISDPDGHVRAMERIVSNLQKDTFRRFLRQSDTRQKIVDLIEEADQAGVAR